MDKRILCDVDGTIADVHAIWLDIVNKRYHKQLDEKGLFPYLFDDISDWDFGPKAKGINLGVKDCIDLVHEVWEDYWRYVALTDVYIPATMQEISSSFGPVDIVTTDKCLDKIEKWLKQEHTLYDRLLHGKDEVKLTYKILIEDNPMLADRIRDDQVLFLRDRPYNRSVKEAHNVIRFHCSYELPDLIDNWISRNSDK